MVICGVELKSSEARLILVDVIDGGPRHLACRTKSLKLGDEADIESIKAFFRAVKTFAHENNVHTFAIKTRAKTGRMAGGGITFKMEAIFQLSDSNVSLVNPVALAAFSKTNLAGIPNTILKTEENPYLCAVYELNKSGNL